jgi:hypothetical protein
VSKWEMIQTVMTVENERETKDTGKEWELKNGNIEGAHVGEPGNVKELDKDQEPCDRMKKRNGRDWTSLMGLEKGVHTLV